MMKNLERLLMFLFIWWLFGFDTAIVIAIAWLLWQLATFEVERQKKVKA